MPSTQFIPGPGDSGQNLTVSRVGALESILRENQLAQSQAMMAQANSQEAIQRAGYMSQLTGQQATINQFLPQELQEKQLTLEETLRQQRLQNETEEFHLNQAKEATQQYQDFLKNDPNTPPGLKHALNPLAGQMIQQMMQSQAQTQQLQSQAELHKAVANKANQWADVQQQGFMSRMYGAIMGAQGQENRGIGAEQLRLQGQQQGFQNKLDIEKLKLQAAREAAGQKPLTEDEELAQLLQMGQMSGDQELVGSAIQMMLMKGNKGVIPMKGGGWDAQSGQQIPQTIDMDKMQGIIQAFSKPRAPTTQSITAPPRGDKTPQKITVRRKSDGAIGTINSSDFSEDRYERVNP